MKKELLVTSLLLGTPLSGLSANEIKVARAESVSDRQEVIDLIFRSAETYRGKFWSVGSDGEWVQQERDFKIQLSFVKIKTDYSVWSQSNSNPELEMDYEVIVEYYFVDDGTKELEEYFYFAKRNSNGKFTMYDCDSTATCKEDFDNSVFWAFDAPEGKGLKFRDGDKIFTHGGRKPVFHQVKE